MPQPHPGSGLSSWLLAVLVAAAIAAALWTNRHKLANLSNPPPAPDLAPTSAAAATEPDAPDAPDDGIAQGAIPFDGFDPDQIYGPPINDTPA